MVKSKRLKSFRCKQPQLRVDKYKCLHESLINGDVDAARLGKRIILPSTFTGEPRYNCKDAFAICRYAGYPNYFIIMTCYPEWDEIKREVTPIGLKAEDRPDILCRVFKIKLDGLIDDLKEEKIFCKILGYVCTIEFQKRGLTPAHILLFMSNKFKPQISDDIDKHITVEIPDENERPNLHGTVQNYMVHGPCELLLKFGYHINVEYTCQTSSIKYLFKYVHKGNDRVTTTLYNTGDPSKATQVIDEIRNYYDCRYISRTVMNIRELTISDDEINQLCLMDIYKILHSYGKTLKDDPLMPLATEVDSSLLTKRVIREELNFNRDDLKKNASEMGFFFVYGHGGTGKIFIWNLMSAEIRSRGDIVLNITSSGITSLLLPNGRMAHSRFKIPLNITKDSVCNIKSGSPQAMLLLKAKLIIWDEAPMFSTYCYEVLDKCLGDIMRFSPTYNKDLSFGGKVVVLGTTASDQDETEKFGECLLKVCDGLICDNMDGEYEIYLPGDIVIPSSD
ncbi:uncharacterized protein [Arachis hypogaea]|uniref:uncharacterized protein n=1 Tax=Arachis hypogaea TaxID=3818 RepID=UPI003B21AE43